MPKESEIKTFKACNRCRKALPGNATAFMVLYALAERGGQKGDHFMCWPSLGRIAQDTGLSTRTICRALNELVRVQLIERLKGSGYRSKVTIINV